MVTFQGREYASWTEARASLAAEPEAPAVALAEPEDAGPLVIDRPQAPPRRQTLLEKYRPRSLSELVGQAEAVAVLTGWLEDPSPQAFVFAGDTGTGKTSAAWALAAELGCNIDAKPSEFGGVWSIPSGDQDAATVRGVWDRLWMVPFDSANGWKVLILNEVEQLSAKVEALWLDRLEAVPDRTAVVFTTNAPDSLPTRFRDRCELVEFASDAADLEPEAGRLAAAVWLAETGQDIPADVLAKAKRRGVAEGRVSFRRVVQAISQALAVRRS